MCVCVCVKTENCRCIWHAHIKKIFLCVIASVETLNVILEVFEGQNKLFIWSYISKLGNGYSKTYGFFVIWLKAIKSNLILNSRHLAKVLLSQSFYKSVEFSMIFFLWAWEHRVLLKYYSMFLKSVWNKYNWLLRNMVRKLF